MLSVHVTCLADALEMLLLAFGASTLELGCMCVSSPGHRANVPVQHIATHTRFAITETGSIIKYLTDPNINGSRCLLNPLKPFTFPYPTLLRTKWIDV